MTVGKKVLHSDGSLESFRPRFIKEQLLNETDVSEEVAEKIKIRVTEKVKKMDIDEVSTAIIRAEVSAQLTNRGLFDAEEDSRKLGMSVKEFEDLVEFGCKDNANIDYNPEMVAKYSYDSISKEYALLKMPKECADAHISGEVHHHDLEYAATRGNCMNYDASFFAKNGLKIDGKGLMGSVAKPAKSLEVLLNHLLQAWMAGATVFSGGQGYVNFNTILAPYAKGRSYEDIKQAIQGFVFNCNMSLICRGGQVLFSSIGLDLSIPDVLKDKPAIGPGGVANGVYGDYQEEADLIFRAVCEVIDEKDGNGSPHRFPNCNGFSNPIMVKKNGCVRIVPIGEFVDNNLKDDSIVYDKSIVSDVDEYKILSYNLKRKKVEWKRITKVIRNPNQQLYRITTKKGTSIDVTREHPFLTTNGENGINNTQGKPLIEFGNSDRLVTLKKPVFSYSENKIGSFIGFFLGDGTVDKNSKNNRLLFTLYKKEKRDYLRNILKELNFVYIERDNSFTVIDTKQNNPKCAELICDCVVMKNNKLLAKYDNSEYYLGILAGLINSDGSIQVSKTIDKPSFILKFSNTNESIIDLFIRIGNLYGLNTKKGIKQEPTSENHNLCYDLFVGGYNMNRLLNNITLQDIHKNKLFDVDFVKNKRDYGSISIDNIQPIDYDGFTYDLEVEDNHNYFIGDCNVLSHNCLFNIREGDLDEYSGNCKLLHELGANNPTIYYVNCTDLERTVMGCRTALPMNYTGIYEKDCTNTGNFMYSTINLPLIALEVNGDKQAFYNKLGDLCEIIYKTLHWRRDKVEDVIYNKHMSDFLLQKDKDTGEPLYNFDTTTMTIGFCGLYECLHILGVDEEEGVRILNYLNSMKDKFKERDGLRWSVIASPAESASHRFATIIKEKYPDAPVQGTKDHYYLTNSSHIPVSNETTIVDHIRNAGIYHPLTLGGNILHIWLGEVWSDPEALWKLNQKVIKEGAIFWAYSKVFTHCSECGFTINDYLEKCPICESKDLVTYDRITGYYLPTNGFNNGKQQEFKDRYRHKIEN